MLEDKLTPAQRIRLEAIAQANMRLSTIRAQGTVEPGRYSRRDLWPDPIGELLDAADRIVEYISGA